MPDTANRTEATLATPEKKLQAEASSAAFGARRIARESRLEALTPSRIRSLLDSAESGDIAAQSELWEHMEERDELIDTHLRTRKAAVLQADRTVVPGDDSPAAGDLADYVTEVLAGIPDFEEALFDLQDAIGQGFAVAEIRWETTKSEWRPVELLYRPQRWFQFLADGRTLAIRPDGYGQDPIPMNPLNFVVHRVKSRSGFGPRQGLLRSCVRPFVLRHYAWKDWAAFAEVFGMPARIGHLPENAAWDSPEATQLFDAVRRMGTDMAAVVRGDASIEILEAASRGDQPYEAIIDLAGKGLTLAILGQLLTSGGEEGGSFALGKVQNLVRQDLGEADARGLAGTLNTQLIGPIVRLNFAGYGATGDSESKALAQRMLVRRKVVPMPKLNLVLEAPVDLDLMSQVAVRMAGSMRVGAGWARETLGIPEPDEGEELLTAPSPAGPAMFSASARPLQRAGKRLALTMPDEVLNSAGFVAEARRGGLAPARLLEMLNQATPPSAAPSAFRRLRPDALSWLREKRVADQSTWDWLSPAGRQRAWWVTGLDERATARLAGLLTEAAANSWTENEFLERIESAGLAVTGDTEPGEGQIAGWQARLVHDQNRWAAYHAANWQEMQETAPERGFVQRMCGGGPCPICSPYCGQVHRLGEIGALYGQLHLGCQCEDVSLSGSEVEREGLTVLDAPDVSVVPEAFRFDRADAYWLESKGQGPASDVGRRDRGMLAGRPLPRELIGG